MCYVTNVSGHSLCVFTIRVHTGNIKQQRPGLYVEPHQLLAITVRVIVNMYLVDSRLSVYGVVST